MEKWNFLLRLGCKQRSSHTQSSSRLTFAHRKTYQLLLKGNLKSWPSIKFNNVPVKLRKPKNNFYALTRISKATWGLSFLTLRTIYGATYLGCVCYGAPVWADRATIGAVRRKLLQGRLAQRALPVLAGLLPVDLEVQRRAAMYYNARPNFSANFLAQRDRSKIDRLLKPLTDVWDELLTEWQCRWESSTKGRHLYQFFPSVHERLKRTWLEVDHCVAQFLTGHGNFKSKLFSFKLVDSPWCQCSTAELQHEQSAHHILWECGLWQSERNTMLDNLIVSSGVVYYTDLVESRANFRLSHPVSCIKFTEGIETIFFSSPLITSSDLFRCGIQDSHSFPWDAPDFSVPILAYRSCSGMG
ncbi:hypothetical protein SFRURICE_007131, partial [Spodoptera frugiperda]